METAAFPLSKDAKGEVSYLCSREAGWRGFTFKAACDRTIECIEWVLLPTLRISALLFTRLDGRHRNGAAQNEKTEVLSGCL